MPRVLPKRSEVDPSKMYVAWDAAYLGPVDCVVHVGTRMRGDHPAVQHAPWLFLPESTPDDEIDTHRRREHAKELAAVAHLAKQTGAIEVRVPDAPPLRDEDAVVAIRRTGVVSSMRAYDTTGELRTVDPGDKLPRNHKMVKRDRAAFVDVTNGVPRERARAANVPVSSQDENGNVRTIYAGQWADQDDPLVIGNPHIFKRPD